MIYRLVSGKLYITYHRYTILPLLFDKAGTVCNLGDRYNSEDHCNNAASQRIGEKTCFHPLESTSTQLVI